MADSILRQKPAINTKTFDCVEMKNRLQADLREQERHLGPEDIRRQRQQWLATSEDGLARWWRTLGTRELDVKPALALREDAMPYGTKNDSKP